MNSEDAQQETRLEGRQVVASSQEQLQECVVEKPGQVKRVTWGQVEAWTILLEDGGGFSETEDEEEAVLEQKDGSNRSWFVIPVLVLAVLAISSSGAVLKSMNGAAPVTKAGWRLQATGMLLLPGFIWQWLSITQNAKQRVLHLSTVILVLISGLSLAVHLGLWVWSLDNTSLPHSLLLVSLSPIVLAVAMWIQCQPLSRGEIAGVGLGVCGVLIISAASHVENDVEVTVLGDVASFLAAAAFVVYLSAGSHLREWMPLYVYSFPVTAAAAAFLALGGVIFEGWSHSQSGLISGPFNWLQREFLLPTLYLAVGPGIVGYTGMNAVLRFCPLLLVTTALTLEPVIGSVIGWMLQQTPKPGRWTCLGGAILLVATVLSNHRGEKRKGDKDPGRFTAVDDPGLTEQWLGSNAVVVKADEQKKSLLASVEVR